NFDGLLCIADRALIQRHFYSVVGNILACLGCYRKFLMPYKPKLHRRSCYAKVISRLLKRCATGKKLLRLRSILLAVIGWPPASARLDVVLRIGRSRLSLCPRLGVTFGLGWSVL